jgi:GH15 family glucan-1,4-alpha-glucosidase
MLYSAIDPKTGVVCEQLNGYSSCPLGWAHAEVLLVARSIQDRRSFYMPKRNSEGFRW